MATMPEWQHEVQGARTLLSRGRIGAQQIQATVRREEVGDWQLVYSGRGPGWTSPVPHGCFFAVQWDSQLRRQAGLARRASADEVGAWEGLSPL